MLVKLPAHFYFPYKNTGIYGDVGVQFNLFT